MTWFSELCKDSLRTDEIPLCRWELEVAMVEAAGVGGVLLLQVLDVGGGHDETRFG